MNRPSTRKTIGHFDVIVVGSGIAGLYAAILAAPHCRVLLVTKGSLEESNTRYAQGGIAVALAPGDSPELHLRDTIAAGDGLCELESVAILTREAPACILDLLRLGVPFDREGDDLSYTLEAAHSLPRVLHAGGDATGAGIERVLVAAIRSAGVTVLEEALCTSLLTDPERVVGVSLLLPEGHPTGSQVDATAANVILASGGAGRLFARTTNPAVATGDGLAIAYRAGAELMDLELMQFHPTALAVEDAPCFLISEAVRGEGGILRDVRGEAFMAGYHADQELAPRDVVARAIHQQMIRTNSPHVFLDITHLPAAKIERRFPSIVRFCRRFDVDPVRHLIPVAPAAHYLMGGIRTDSWARTTLPGLLACGEVACTGVHGANRLASNSLLEGLVFAKRAVDGMLHDTDTPRESPRTGQELPWCAPTLVTTGKGPRAASKGELASILWRDASLVRSAQSLFAARGAIAGHMNEAPSQTVNRSDHELANLTLLSALMVESALLREESRGAHFRSDFSQRDPSWQGHIVVSRDSARFQPLALETARHPRVAGRTGADRD